MNQSEVIRTLSELGNEDKGTWDYDPMCRDDLEKWLNRYNLEVVHNESGNYDLDLDGWIIFKTEGGIHYKVFFEDDSMSGGRVEDIRQVQGRQKTITVWE